MRNTLSMTNEEKNAMDFASWAVLNAPSIDGEVFILVACKCSPASIEETYNYWRDHVKDKKG